MLEAVRDKVPPGSTKPYTNPVNGNPEAVRNNLREVMRLLKQAGYEVRDQQLVNVKTGEPYVIELLSEGSGFERVFLFYKPLLDRLGIVSTVRTVDEVQYQNRLRSWDFDIITAAWPTSLTPGNELHGYWGSRAAQEPGSPNRIGIKNPAVDAMIDQVAFAKAVPTSRRLRERSIVFCCGTTTSFRNGTITKRAPRDGIVSVIPTRCQNSAEQLFPLSGGGTSKKLQKRASLHRF